MHISKYIKEDMINGISIRFTLFCSGCLWNCPNCFNPETHNFTYGDLFDEEYQNKVIQDIKNFKYGSNLSLLGGDPFFSAEELYNFIIKAKKQIPDLNTWVWTGFTWEMLLKNTDDFKYKLLKECDVIIDGQFKELLKDKTLKFRGSSNQRIINIPESLKQNKVVLYME